MVKKVTLDTLDIEENDMSSPIHDAQPQKENNQKTQKKRLLLPMRQLFVASMVLVITIAVALSLWLYEQTVPTSIAPKVRAAGNDLEASMNDFFIPVKDDTGKERALVCTVLIKLNDNQYQENIKMHLVSVRNVIFRALQKQTVKVMLQPEGRAVIKEEIGAELVKYLGKDSINQIYFTKFVVL